MPGVSAGGCEVGADVYRARSRGELGAVVIRYETKFTPALSTGLVGPDSKAQVLHRWRCCTCGAYGVWLLKLEIVERNASMHARVCMALIPKEI